MIASRTLEKRTKGTKGRKTPPGRREVRPTREKRDPLRKNGAEGTNDRKKGGAGEGLTREGAKSPKRNSGRRKGDSCEKSNRDGKRKSRHREPDATRKEEGSGRLDTDRRFLGRVRDPEGGPGGEGGALLASEAYYLQKSTGG